MDELDRFTDPWDWYGLRVWRNPRRSRLVSRLAKIRIGETIPCRRGVLILRGLLGRRLDRVPPLELSWAYQRLLLIEWLTSFGALGFFQDFEIRAYARLHGPPPDTTLGRFWYGVLAGDLPRDIESEVLRRTSQDRPALRDPSALLLSGACLEG